MKSFFFALLSLTLLVSADASALDVRALQATLTTATGRPQADKDRDAQRRPAEVVNFLGVDAGMTAIDLVAAAGFYSEVLSYAVGPRGKVFLQNAPAALTGQRGERTLASINERLANNRLANVQRLDREPSDLGLPDNSVDVAIIALEFHELYRSSNPNAAAEFLAEIHRVLKPGGVLGVIDHAGYPVYDNGTLHRALEYDVVRDAQASGFTVQANSLILRNPDDDRSKGVFDASLRGNTDRFVLKLVKR